MPIKLLEAEDKKKFLEVLRDSGANRSMAARACGFNLSSFRDHKKKDPEFSEAWDEAVDEAIDILKREAWRRAFAGTRKPIMYQGKVVGVVREYDTDLLKFILESERPDIYARRYKTEITGRDGRPLIPEINMVDVARRLSFILTQAAQQAVPSADAAKDDLEEGKEVVH